MAVMKVYAKKAGFYKKVVRQVGSEFDVKDEKELRPWMVCKDDALQKKHLANCKAVKAKLKAGK